MRIYDEAADVLEKGGAYGNPHIQAAYGGRSVAGFRCFFYAGEADHEEAAGKAEQGEQKIEQRRRTDGGGKESQRNIYQRMKDDTEQQNFLSGADYFIGEPAADRSSHNHAQCEEHDD